MKTKFLKPSLTSRLIDLPYYRAWGTLKLRSRAQPRFWHGGLLIGRDHDEKERMIDLTCIKPSHIKILKVILPDRSADKLAVINSKNTASKEAKEMPRGKKAAVSAKELEGMSTEAKTVETEAKATLAKAEEQLASAGYEEIGKNIRMAVQNGILFLQVNLSNFQELSTSKHSMIIATTQGDKKIPDRDYPSMKFGLNVYDTDLTGYAG